MCNTTIAMIHHYLEGSAYTYHERVIGCGGINLHTANISLELYGFYLKSRGFYIKEIQIHRWRWNLVHMNLKNKLGEKAGKTRQSRKKKWNSLAITVETRDIWFMLWFSGVSSLEKNIIHFLKYLFCLSYLHVSMCCFIIIVWLHIWRFEPFSSPYLVNFFILWNFWVYN